MPPISDSSSSGALPPSRTTGSPRSPLVSGLITLLVLGTVLVLFGWLAYSNVKTITEPKEGVCPPSAEEGGKKPGDASTPTMEEPPAGGQTQVDFWSEDYPILERSCLSCHGPKKQRGNFRVDRREYIFRKDGITPVIVAGKSAESPLIAIVSGLRKDMPMADVHQLPEQQVALLKAWIDVGAPWPVRTGRE